MDDYLQKAVEIRKRLDSAAPVPGMPRAAEIEGELSFIRRLFGARVVLGLERSFAPPLVAVVTGGTNVGKSEVFNAIAGARISAPDPRAGMTRRPAVFSDSSNAGFIGNPGFLEGFGRRELSAPSVLNSPAESGPMFHFSLKDSPAARDFVLVDSPDVDSNRTENLDAALRLLAAADTVVFVTSPSKYNDEACVRFLEAAISAGASMHALINFLGRDAAEVVADFAASVLNQRSAGREIRVFRAMRFKEGSGVPQGLSPVGADLREALKADGEPGEKRRRAREALGRVRAGFSSSVEAITAEAAKIRAFLASQSALAEAACAEYLKALDAEKFPELEAVFGEVLDRFSVPVVDDVLRAPGRALRFIASALRGGGSPAEAARAAVARRKEREAKKASEAADMLRLRVVESLFKAASADPLFAEIQRAAASGPLIRPVEAEARSIWSGAQREFDSWIDGMKAEMIEKIGRSPNLRALVKASKAALQIGAGVAGILVTGGIGPTDLVTGPAAAKLMQLAIETFGSAYFHGKRSAFRELHAVRFRAMAGDLVLKPLSQAMPAVPAEGELEETARLLAEFEIPEK